MLIAAIFIGGLALFITGISVGLKVGEYDDGYNEGRKHGRREAMEYLERNYSKIKWTGDDEHGKLD